MRINDDPADGFGHRRVSIQDAADLLDCNKTAAVVTACEHLKADADAKRKVAEVVADLHRDGILAEDDAQRILEPLQDPFLAVTPTLDLERSTGLEVEKSSSEYR